MRILASVYDKAGFTDFVRKLGEEVFCEVVSSGGTSEALTAAGIEHQTVEQVTNTPQMPGGRVKTLHPKILGGVLADRNDKAQLDWVVEYGGGLFDLVICNLYPFGAKPSIEMIDVGGPTMVRAAAKNHAHVGVIVDPADYGWVLDELKASGKLSDASRRRLARKAFAHTAAYDAAITTWFDATDSAGDASVLPPTVHLALEQIGGPLRYGENPHQAGALFREIGLHTWLDDVVQHFGLPMSYLNWYDLAAAWVLVHDLGDRPTAVIVKHANPCGVAVADDLPIAYRLAFECDSKSAFGGIVAVNRIIDRETAEEIVKAAQADVIIAPGYEDGVIDMLRAKRKNTRVLECATLPTGDRFHFRQINGGWLVQEPHSFPTSRADWKVVTKVQPTEEQWRDIELAWRVCGHAKSNTIVVGEGGVVWGIGVGQQNREDSAVLAATKSDGRAENGAAASDAFYPFPDAFEATVRGAGSGAVIQPGGSIRDAQVIAKADELRVAMIFTGERHFNH